MDAPKFNPTGQDSIMMYDRKTETQELSLDQLAFAAGGASPQLITKLMSEILSNVSKTRSEISMTFARNARA